jgi:hypothetical protein
LLVVSLRGAEEGRLVHVRGGEGARVAACLINFRVVVAGHAARLCVGRAGGPPAGRR